MQNDKKKYIIKQQQPCADYGKVTVEGTFDLKDKAQLYKNLNSYFEDYTNIANGKILIVNNESYNLYIYDESRFVISKLESVERAYDILNKIFS